MLVVFGMGSVQEAVARTTFDISVVANGGATIYIEIPPQLSSSCGLLARVWLSALLQLSLTAHSGRSPVLFVVDDAAGLEMFPQLLSAQRLPAEVVEIWTFWESLDQLSVKYPTDWSAFIDSCVTIRALGLQSPPVAVELAKAFNVRESELRQVSPGYGLTLSSKISATDLSGDLTPGPLRELEKEHVVTFATSSAGKWKGVASAILERNKSSLVVVESAGECYRLTAGGRKEIGHVVCLDPFGVVGEESNSFNPFDLLRMEAPQSAPSALDFAESILPQENGTIDPYWRTSTVRLLHGLLVYMLSKSPEGRCDLVQLREMVSASELPSESHEFVGHFFTKPDKGLPSLLAVAYQALGIFGDPRIANSVVESSFDLAEFLGARPLTIYIELPAIRWASHGLLVHLWFTSLLIGIGRLGSTRRTKFVVECPGCNGMFPLLRIAQALPSADTWTFWESLGQLRSGYPTQWSAFLANASRVEVVGPQNSLAASELAPIFGLSEESIKSVQKDRVMALYNFGDEKLV